MTAAVNYERKISLLEDTLNNMIEGVLMFDNKDNLRFCNARYIKMYDVDPDVVKRGCTFSELIGHHMKKDVSSVEVQKYCRKILSRAKVGESNTSFRKKIADGRTMHIVNHHLASGGVLVTHEDITQQTRDEAKITHMAHHDALTDLPNCTLFHIHLDRQPIEKRARSIIWRCCL